MPQGAVGGQVAEPCALLYRLPSAPSPGSCLGAVTVPLIDLIISPPQGEVQPLAGGAGAWPRGRSHSGVASERRRPGCRASSLTPGDFSIPHPGPRRLVLFCYSPAPGSLLRTGSDPSLPPPRGAPGCRWMDPLRSLPDPAPPCWRREHGNSPQSCGRGRNRKHSVCCVFIGFVFLPKNYPLCLCAKEAMRHLLLGTESCQHAFLKGGSCSLSSLTRYIFNIKTLHVIGYASLFSQHYWVAQKNTLV